MEINGVEYNCISVGLSTYIYSAWPLYINIQAENAYNMFIMTIYWLYIIEVLNQGLTEYGQSGLQLCKTNM